MELLSTSDADLKKAADAITAGGLVAFPTETVYGLGADAFNPSALAKVFEAKNRPRFDPLIIHIAEPGALTRVADIAVMNAASRKMLSAVAEKLWPGPLTLVLPKQPGVPDIATAGLATAAIRLPSHPTARKLIRFSTGAVAAPSANPFGYLSPTRAEHVREQLGEKVDFIIDGGKTTVGVESTVLDLSRGIPRILRPGGTPKEAIETLIGKVEMALEAESGIAAGAVDSHGAPLSPGQLKSHYSPHTPLILYAPGELAGLPEAPDEGRLYFSPPGGSKTQRGAVRVLSEKGDLREAAANLFEMLHELDGLRLALIRAEKAPASGLGIAINDRLHRAENTR